MLRRSHDLTSWDHTTTCDTISHKSWSAILLGLLVVISGSPEGAGRGLPVGDGANGDDRRHARRVSWSTVMRSALALLLVFACGGPSHDQLIDTRAAKSRRIPVEAPAASTDDREREQVTQQFEDMETTQRAYKEAKQPAKSQPASAPAPNAKKKGVAAQAPAPAQNAKKKGVAEQAPPGAAPSK